MTFVMEQSTRSMPSRQSLRTSDATFTTSSSSASPPSTSASDGSRALFNGFQANRFHDSRSLINNDAQDDDDETVDLIKDPRRFAESGPLSLNQSRRNTNSQAYGLGHALAQLPVIQQMANLSLNLNATEAYEVAGNGYTSPESARSPGSALSPVMMSSGGPVLHYPHGNQHFQRGTFPPVNPADQNPPCNTLYVGNLPIDTSEDELKAMFSKQRGYKRLCFRTKQQSPLCFVEFADTTFATKALHELYGHPLHNSVKGGIRLSFSKNPLGVRSGQAPGSSGHQPPHMGTGASTVSGLGNPGFSTATQPPPGLAAPPGLGPSRVQYSAVSPVNSGMYGNGGHYVNIPYNAQHNARSGWATPAYSTSSSSNIGSPSASVSGSYSTNGATTISMNGMSPPDHGSLTSKRAVSPSASQYQYANMPHTGPNAANNFIGGMPNSHGRTPLQQGNGFPSYMMGR